MLVECFDARGLRLASTEDPRDGPTYLAAGSVHYLNLHPDSGWRDSDETATEHC